MPTIADVQQVDEVLQNLSRMYRNDAASFVWNQVFPQMPVAANSGTYYTYDVGYWFSDEMQRRAPGTTFAKSDYELSTATYLTQQFGLETDIEDEVQSNAQSPLDPMMDAVTFLEQKLAINAERRLAAAAMATSIWTTDNTTASDWDDLTNGVPITNVQVAKRTVRGLTGMTIDSILMGDIVADALVLASQIVNKIQYVDRVLPADVRPVISAALELPNVYVSKSFYNTAAEGVTASMAAIIDDDALVFHRGGPGARSASAMALLTWDGGGGMGTYDRYYSDERKSDIARVQSEMVYQKIGADLGYFFSDVV